MSNPNAIYLRLKYGIHTIFVEVMGRDRFRSLDRTLMGILRDRYPAGLKKSHNAPSVTALPAASDRVELVWARLANPKDPESGWEVLKTKGADTFNTVGLRDNDVLTFAWSHVKDGADPNFEVEWPDMG